MKKKFLSGLAVSILALAITSGLHAQESGSTAKIKTPGSVESLIADETAAANNRPASVLPGRINIKVVKSFGKSFGNIPDKKWYVLEDGYVVYFKVDDISMKAVYNKKGTWMHTLRFYTEKNLPFAVRDLVKRTYYDFSIFLVIEIETDNKIIYLLKMEDKNSLKTVRVIDGEINEIEHYSKSS
jgi:hypothetical protein